MYADNLGFHNKKIKLKKQSTLNISSSCVNGDTCDKTWIEPLTEEIFQ